jgi:predicted ATPase
VSARSVSDFERGLPQRPRRDTLDLLAKALGLPPTERAAFVAAGRRLVAQAPSGASASAVPGVTADRVPEALSPAGPLLGREAELAALAEVLQRPGTRLVTLTGPGGVGKTRLAAALAARLEGAWPDRACIVPLAALRDPALVLPTIARALGVREEPGRPLSAVLAAYLRERALLLVLDNCEQVAEAAPELADLLTACPRLTLLATSRAPFRLRGEQEWPVPPLELPSASQRDPARLAQSPAVALFAARARAARPDFALDAANAAAVAALVTRLDGLPLAIELAAALLEHLAHPLQTLVAGARDLPPRQRSMRAAIAWSYDLLPPDQQTRFRRLAVFRGGFTLEAARAVAADDGEERAGPLAPRLLADLLALVEASLVRREAGPGQSERLGLLETIRDFAAERLEEAGELEASRCRHLTYFLALAEAAEPALRGREQGVWLTRLDHEHDNLRAALERAVAANDAEAALRLVAALGPFWRTRGHYVEGQRSAAALALTGGPEGVRARALNAAAVLARQRSDLNRAAAWHAEALALANRSAEAPSAALALGGLGSVALVRGDLAAAEHWYRAALDRAQAADLSWERASATYNLANTLAYLGRVEEVAAVAHDALGRFRAIGDQRRWRPRPAGYRRTVARSWRC